MKGEKKKEDEFEKWDDLEVFIEVVLNMVLSIFDLRNKFGKCIIQQCDYKKIPIAKHQNDHHNP